MDEGLGLVLAVQPDGPALGHVQRNIARLNNGILIFLRAAKRPARLLTIFDPSCMPCPVRLRTQRLDIFTSEDGLAAERRYWLGTPSQPLPLQKL